MGDQDELREHLAKLIIAFHILHYKEVLDCYGHVSIRNPLNHNTFFSSSNPANLITAPGDLQMWNVGDGTTTHAADIDIMPDCIQGRQ
jgi:hypothetical protein